MEAAVPGRQPLRWPYIVVAVPLGLMALFHVLALFGEPEGRAVALGYFGSAATVLAAWLGRRWLARPGRPEAHGAAWRFILLGSLGAAWVETLFWAAEKVTGATGVAASPNLLVDLLVTMPWYVSMVAVLWLVYRRFRYPWPVVALLGGLYEVGADGIVGHVIGGNAITVEYLGLLVLYYWTFVVVYAPMVLPAVWSAPLPAARRYPLWQRALAALLPLLPLLPYYAVVRLLFG